MSRLHYALSQIAFVFVTFSAPFLSHWSSPITVDFIPSPFLSRFFFVSLKGDIHLQLQYFVFYYSISAASSSSGTFKKGIKKWGHVQNFKQIDEFSQAMFTKASV
jgi:hypothetical protein